MHPDARLSSRSRTMKKEIFFLFMAIPLKGSTA
jgi:hypothetical protein